MSSVFRPWSHRSAILGLSLVAACAQHVEAPTADVSVLTEGPYSAGLEIVLDGSASVDSQVNIDKKLLLELGYQWRVVSAPAGSMVAFNNTGLPIVSFTPDLYGEYVFGLIVNNGMLDSAEVKTTLTVDECGNALPVISGGAASPAAPNFGDVIQFTANLDDPDNSTCGMSQSHSWQWAVSAQPAGSSAVLHGANTQTPWLQSDVVGDYTVSLVVTDSTGRSSERAENTVTVSDCGFGTPLVTEVLVNPGSPSPDQPVDLTITVEDADNADSCGMAQDLQTVSSFVGRPAGSSASFTPNEGNEPGFTPDMAGTYIVRTTVTDEAGFSSFLDTNIQVDACGLATPVINTITVPDAPYAVGQAIPLSFDATDLDNDPAGCDYAQDLLITSTIVEQPAGANGSITPALGSTPMFIADMPGDYVIRVVVTDDTGRSSFRDQRISVGECGSHVPGFDAPTVSDGPYTVGTPINFTLAPVDLDNDSTCALDQTLNTTSVFAQIPAGSTSPLLGGSGVTPSFTPDMPGTYVIRSTVVDDSGASSWTDSSVTVGECGGHIPGFSAPTVSDGPYIVGTPINFTLAPVDLDNDSTCALNQALVSTSAFAQVPVGSASVLLGTNGVTPNFTPDMPGTYVIRSTVIDDSGASSWTDSSVTVGECGSHAPSLGNAVINNGPHHVGGAVDLSFTPSDLDNGSVCGLGQTLFTEHRLAQVPVGSSAVLLGGAGVTPSFTPDVPGDYVIRSAVTDDSGRSSAWVDNTVTVTACDLAAMIGVNSPFTFAPSQDIVLVDSISTGNGLLLDASASTQCDALPLSYQWNVLSQPNGSYTDFNNTWTVTSSVIPYQVGNYVIELTVTDGYTTASTTLTADAVPISSISVGAGISIFYVAGNDANWNNPEGLFVDGNTLYTVQNGGFSVTATDLITGLTTPVSLGGNLINVHDVVSFGGSLYVTAQDLNDIIRVAADGTQTPSQVGVPRPKGMAYVNAGGFDFLYVVDSNNDRIEQYTIAQNGTVNLNSIDNLAGRPNRLVDVSAGIDATGQVAIFATDSNRGVVYRRSVGNFGGGVNPSEPIKNLQSASGIAVRPNSLNSTLNRPLQFAVADDQTGIIYLVDDCGNGNNNCPFSVIAAGLWTPKDLAFDATGTVLYVSDNLSNAVYAIDLPF